MAYYRGDYYVGSRGRLGGDYYRGRMHGDPFWGAIVKGITAVGRFALGIPSAPKAATAAAAPAIAGGLPAILSKLPLPSRQIPGMISAGAGATAAAAGRLMRRPASQRIAQLLAAGAIVEIGGRLFDAVTGRPVSRRRTMNVANVKALRRSIRRVVGFGKLCASARSSVGKAATQLQYGRRRSYGGTARAAASARAGR